jgi:hypothetical protein
MTIKLQNNKVQDTISTLKAKLTDSEWESFVDIARQQLGEELPLDQFEWVIRNTLRKNKEFELNKSYDLMNKGKGFKSGNIQLIRDTRDSKIFISSFHIDRQDGSNKLANITLYKFERKRNETTDKLEWEFDCKILIDNSSQRDYSINKLFNYIKTQLSLDGHKLDSKFAKIIEGKTESELITQQDILDKIKNLSDPEKLNDIISTIVENGSVVLSSKTYQELIQTRYRGQTISDYEKDLKTFKELIDNEKTTETDMQKFLGDKNIDRSWFFGLDYIKTYPKFNPGLPCEYDFLIRRFNLVFDIIELKGPNEKIIETFKIAEREKPDPRIDYAYSSIFGRALHQVIDYLQQYEQHFDLIKNENPSVINFGGGQFPRGKIIMSKRSLINNIEDIHKLNKQFTSLEVLTYDDLYERANNIIEFLKKTKEQTEKPIK